VSCTKVLGVLAKRARFALQKVSGVIAKRVGAPFKKGSGVLAKCVGCALQKVSGVRVLDNISLFFNRIIYLFYILTVYNGLVKYLECVRDRYGSWEGYIVKGRK
jgi:hypothetical protein